MVSSVAVLRKFSLFILIVWAPLASAHYTSSCWFGFLASEIRMPIHRKALKALGGEYRKIRRYPNGDPFRGVYFRDSSMTFEEVYAIEKLPPSGKRSPYVVALTHPDLAYYLEILKAFDYHLLVDLSFKGRLAGLQNHNGNAIFITPYSDWTIFMHEFQHMLVDLALSHVGGFEKFNNQRDAYIESLCDLGLERDELVKAKAAGLGLEAVQEQCAKVATIKAGGSEIKASKYAASFILEELEKKNKNELSNGQLEYWEWARSLIPAPTLRNALKTPK